MLSHRHRAIIWYAFGVAWLNSRGVACLKFDALSQWDAVFCAVYRMQAMTHSVANDPSQQAVKLVVAGPGFFLTMLFWIVFWGPMAMKNGVNWGNGFAIGDANTKNCPLKCLRFHY